MMKAGLLAVCLGAVLLALATHLGGVTGFVGTAVWATPAWRPANAIGWLLLIGGFSSNICRCGAHPAPRGLRVLCKPS